MSRIHRVTVQKKCLNDQDNHYGVMTHLEPEILEYEVKWVLGSITMSKASGGDGTPAELLHVLKDDAVKVLLKCQQMQKTQQWSQDWKRSVFLPIPKKDNAKECSSESVSHALVSDSWDPMDLAHQAPLSTGFSKLPHNCIHFTC